MKRIYSEIDNDLHRRYRAYLEMNDITMVEHIRLRVLWDIMNWEKEHPEEVEYYEQLNEITKKLDKLKAP